MDLEDDSRPRAAARPDSLKKLRACKTCKLIKTYDQFYSNFCENCPHARPEGTSGGMRDDYVQAQTTPDYEGMVSMMQPQHSWVGRWLKMRYVDDEGAEVVYLPGVYAISLPGEEAMAAEAAQRGNQQADEEDQYEDEGGDEEDQGGDDDDSNANDRGAASSSWLGTSASGGGPGRPGASTLSAFSGSGTRDAHDPAAREAMVEGALIAPDDDDE